MKSDRAWQNIVLLSRADLVEALQLLMLNGVLRLRDRR